MHDKLARRRRPSLRLAAAWVLILPAFLLASRLPARQGRADVTGPWELTVVSQEGTAHPSMVLKQEGERVTGSYAGNVTGSLEGTVKGSEINLRLRLKFQDAAYVVTYSGTVNGDIMKGTVRFGNSGSGTWSANRKKSQAR
jgi:hypothetical protein